MKKQYRIKKSEDIETILKEKDSTANKHFVIYKAENHENNHFKYALSVPKKYGSAVERNKVKRRIRAVIRSIKIKNDYDFFIIVRTTTNILSFQEIKKELINVLNKSQLLEVQNEQQN